MVPINHDPLCQIIVRWTSQVFFLTILLTGRFIIEVVRGRAELTRGGRCGKGVCVLGDGVAGVWVWRGEF